MSEELTRLGKIVEEKRRIYEALGQQNMWGRTIEERVQQDINYRIAQSEFGQAQANYYNALASTALRNSCGIQQQMSCSNS